MLIIDTRDSDNIDKALKKYKKKFEQAGILRQLRARTAYVKKSVANRNKVLKAAYRDKVIAEMEG
ncbi:MAG: 30S ribosomal protein S21 [Bacteroidetes bacterium]|nr:30S ribosomal protein S21 [Bacteroidota bacterium]